MTTLRLWREVAVPHADVLKGTFQQAEFAADITAVRTGKAPDLYKDVAAYNVRHTSSSSAVSQSAAQADSASSDSPPSSSGG